MAIFHFKAQIISRGKGKSAVGAAAYRAAEKLYSEKSGQAFNYSKKKGVIFSEILAPANSPAWAFHRESLWNNVEQFEKRKDAQLAREIEVALPIELPLAQQKELIREYLNDNCIVKGMIADYSIHDVDSHNPHVHIMLTLRELDGDTFNAKKNIFWNSKEQFEQWREQWAAVTNKHLALNGIDKKIDHRSYAEQGIDLEPTIHRGYLSYKSLETLDRVQEAKAIQERNYARLIACPAIALTLLTHHESVFSHQDLARFANERTETPEQFECLKVAIETSDDLVDLGKGLDGKQYYTSKKVLARENELFKKVDTLSLSFKHKLNPEDLKFVLADKTLNEEQQTAFNHVLSGNDLSLVVGYAGTGKSYLMSAVKEAYEAEGYRVIGTALSGRAAEGLAQSSGIESRTIARYLIDWENGRYELNDKTVLVIDEIGMVGSKQMHLLLHYAAEKGAKIIGCGDPEQIPPVEAGCPFRVMLEQQPHIKLQNVVRQEADWQRQATIELSTQQHGKALYRYQEHGYIHEHETREAALSSLVNHWSEYQKDNQDKTAIMMSYRNIDVLTLNLTAREQLLENNILDNQHALKVNTERFGELEFSINERILFLQNDNELEVKNGLLGTVQNINTKDNILTVELDRGDIVAIDTTKYNDIAYGYAATVHKLQGETVDKSFVLATPHFDRFITNVSMSRHRDEVELHYSRDDFSNYDELKNTLAQGQSKILATEFAKARGIAFELNKEAISEVDPELEKTLKKFAELDAAYEKAMQQPYLAFQRLAIEAVEKYALEIAKDKSLLQKIEKNRPELSQRISLVIEQEQILELEL